MTYAVDNLEPVRPRRSLASQPAFYLIYLIFYFVPWFFEPPETKDILAFICALAVFLPVYFFSYNKPSSKFIGSIIAIQLIGFIIAPFNGNHGVFYIYASVQAGFQRPKKHAGILIAVLALSYLALSLVLHSNWIEVGFVIFMGTVTGISCMASAEEIERREHLERTSVLDKQLAALAERERIAADLHDLLGHTLTMVALKAEVADKFLDKDKERARQEIREIRNEARSALSDVRQAVSGMSATTIEAEIERAKIALRAANIQFSILGDIPKVTAQQDKAFGLAIRESMTNIVRHSNAKHAKLSFEYHKGGLSISIKDNGIGGSYALGAGLTGLKRRIENLGGSVNIDMSKGAHIILSTPGGPS